MREEGVSVPNQLQRLQAEAAIIGRVFICDPEHPHHGESGTLTGEVISLFGTSMAKVQLQDCKHGTDACFVQPGQLRQEKRGRR
jgi:hypothetical protein